MAHEHSQHPDARIVDLCAALGLGSTAPSEPWNEKDPEQTPKEEQR